MKLRRKVAAPVLIGTMAVCGEVRLASAQDAPTDLRMLMNVDLFEPRHNDAKGAAAPAASPSDDSMLDQIRALDAMGYLGNREGGGNGAPARGAAGRAPESAPCPPESTGAPPQSDASEWPGAPMSSSQPSNDVEGPQP